ncbi:hypothetical protein [uncultured Microscilla sp.]|uniref:hypothetical protein n=1 Tax=uncultured Microscilla sp. TaxID=432653 RepID=UPI0026040055|nr:hypothetical protein [uncultured Microscilla sp.]
MKINLTHTVWLSLIVLIMSAAVPIIQPSEHLPRLATPHQAFDKMMSVLMHKRCMNCHPSDDRPRQGEDSHVHNFGVQRGKDNHGTLSLRCQTCHQSENNPYSGVPGAPHWGLAPKSMGWQGLSRVAIAKALLDPAKNGDRSLKDIVKHLTEDKLVAWAWNPGVDASGKARETPPVSRQAFIKAVKQWAEAGANIPEK